MIAKYDILNPITDKRSPFYNQKKGLFYFHTKSNYKYYLECSKLNEYTKDIEFYILLSNKKFDINCKLCHVDNYGRCQIRPAGKLKEYIIQESKERGNFIMDYLESEEYYDVYKLE